jgi:O-antigen ligase
MRPLALALAAVCMAMAIQLVPIPRDTLQNISPATATILGNYDLLFANDPAAPAPLSVNPGSTQTALLATASLGLYLLGVPALLARRGIRTLPAALALFAVPLALYGIYTRQADHGGMVYGFWRSVEGGGADLAGPFINRNHFAGWMLMAACLLTGWLFGKLENLDAESARSTRSRKLAWWSSVDTNTVFTAVLSLLITVLALFWVVSRSAIVALAVATVAFAALLYSRRHIGPERRRMVYVTLAGVILAGAAWRGPDLILQRFQDETSFVGRVDAWRDATAVMADFPLFGTGVNTYADAMLFYQTRNRAQYMSRAHNDYVQVMAEGGLLVGVPVAAVLICLAVLIVRNVAAARREARGYWIRAGAGIGVLALGVQELFEFSMQIPANAFFCATLAAIAITPATPTSRRTAENRRDNIASREGQSSVTLS